jgi:hypothetical protein
VAAGGVAAGYRGAPVTRRLLGAVAVVAVLAAAGVALLRAGVFP